MSAHKSIISTLQTTRDFIRWGASRMNEADVHFGHGTDNAIDEAAALVLHALYLAPDLHETYLQAALTAEEKHEVLEILQRRIDERIPAAYLTQQIWFMGLPFYIDERVLIPRSPIAELIERQFQPWLEQPEAVERILDLGAGCGCIGIACAYVFPDACIDISDISSDALEVAQQNIDEHDLNDCVSAIRSDLFENLEGECYDLIISNPPYVSREELAQLPREYEHEPVLGLAAGEDGLDVIRQILQQAVNYLNPEGMLIVEAGSAQEALMAAFPEVPFVWLDFEHGGEGVFLLTAEQLMEFRNVFY